MPCSYPDGFLEHVVSESVYAGNAMRRRALFMYGASCPGARRARSGELSRSMATGTVGLLPHRRRHLRRGDTGGRDQHRLPNARGVRMQPDSPQPGFPQSGQPPAASGGSAPWGGGPSPSAPPPGPFAPPPRPLGTSSTKARAIEAAAVVSGVLGPAA